MSNTSLVTINEKTNEAILSFKDDDTKRAIKLNIKDDILLPSHTIPAIGTLVQDFNMIKDHLETNEPSFVIVKLDRSSTTPEYLMIIFIPPSCQIRPRTLYASSRVPVQRYLAQIFAGIGDYFVDDINDLNYETYVRITRKDMNAMSFEEIRAHLNPTKGPGSRRRPPQNFLPTHESFSWPITDDLLIIIKEFANDVGPRIIAGIASTTGGAISSGGTGDSLKEIDKSSPKYCAIRHSYNGNDIKVFVLYCPENAKSREKMMASTCKQSFLKGCEDAGIVFNETIEIRESNIFTDDYIESVICSKDV